MTGHASPIGFLSSFGADCHFYLPIDSHAFCPEPTLPGDPCKADENRKTIPSLSASISHTFQPGLLMILDQSISFSALQETHRSLSDLEATVEFHLFLTLSCSKMIKTYLTVHRPRRKTAITLLCRYSPFLFFLFFLSFSFNPLQRSCRKWHCWKPSTVVSHFSNHIPNLLTTKRSFKLLQSLDKVRLSQRKVVRVYWGILHFPRWCESVIHSYSVKPEYM